MLGFVLIIGAAICVLLLAAGLIRAASRADRAADRHYHEHSPLTDIEFRAWDALRREEGEPHGNDTDI